MGLRLLPLGGLGEIGRNCLLIEHRGEQGDDALLIDCGVQFPSPDDHGVDLILPDFGPLRARRDRLRGLVLTHGHEDHIGAVPYLLREVPVPVYGSAFTLRLLSRKLEELDVAAELHELHPRARVDLGCFGVEAIRVTHSIPDSFALAVETPAGTLVHTGDFKIDHAPIDGEATDLSRFAELGDRGVLALLSDSTNATREGSCPGEITVGPPLRRIVETAPGRVVSVLFASNIHRVQQILDIARAAGRKVALLGRRLEDLVELAGSLRKLSVPPGLLVSHETARDLPADQVCVLSTGAQAEPFSGLSKLAAGTHNLLRLDAGDRVVFSASRIPGNELALNALVNRLARLHVDVFQEPEHAIHVSGHGYRNDQRLMLRLVRPHAFIPVHGEARHLAHHRALAIECGVPPGRCLEVFDGDWVELSAGGARVMEHEPLRVSFLDRFGGTDVPEDVVHDRRELAGAGLVIAVVHLDRGSGALLREVEVQLRGLPAARDLQSQLLRELGADLGQMPPALRLDTPAVEEVVVRAVRRVAKRNLDRRPVVMPVVLKL